ncbi:OmpH family outer membrane protein [Alkalilimnicola sp. S0819]|uniref:OmpH family outer membrane protein n=1 Tax=Alkalilimnicola sp. S0819 TaxID=2613922 RepID=UPI001D00FDA9|nr:OmpH family outer membrane protein [Alkalilimnicola sp. S0819]
MKKALVLAISLAAAALPLSAGALKIGAVNPARISAEAPQADYARERLEREFAPRDQEVSELRQALAKMEERLSRDGAVMTDAQRRDLERGIISQQREIRRAQEEFREDFNIRRNEELVKLQRRIVETIQTFAKRNGFDLIVSDGVIYASNQVDITDRIIQLLEQEPAGAAR